MPGAWEVLLHFHSPIMTTFDNLIYNLQWELVRDVYSVCITAHMFAKN